jgi:hypothetical protein
MPDYLLLMHDDAAPDDAAWSAYLARLRETGRFQGGSAVGAGLCARKAGNAPAITAHITGFLRIRAAGLEEARSFLDGNPIYEAGGTVEICELPTTS